MSQLTFRIGCHASCLLLLAVLLPSSMALRFIAAPLMAISPAMDVMGVAAQLHSRGHEVLVIVGDSALDFVKSAAARHSSNTTAESMNYILINLTHREFGQQKPLKLGEVPPPSHFAVPDTWPASTLFKITSGADMLLMFRQASVARQLLANTTLIKVLRDFQADAWMSVGISIGPSVVRDNTGCIMSHALGTHMVDVSGNTLFEGPLNTPQFGTLLTPADLKTLPGMALNLATWTYNKLVPTWDDWEASPLNQLRQEYGLPWAASSCPLTEGIRWIRGRKTLTCEALVEVIMGTWLVEWPRTLPANTIVVGPGTPRRAHPITPQDAADFVNSAHNGVVLAAFGTVHGSTLRPEDLHELAKGFASLDPIRVLWALKPSALRPGIRISDLPLGSNTLVVSWVDYNDVLGHPNTKAFVSHCGMHSVNEAAFHGVPVVAIPFQMEQAEHATKMAARGAALICKQSPAFRRGSTAAEAMTFTAQHVAGLIREVLTNQSCAQSAAAISVALQQYASQRHPYERAADEFELAIRAADVLAATQLVKSTAETGQSRALPVADKAGGSKTREAVAGKAGMGAEQRRQGHFGGQEEL